MPRSQQKVAPDSTKTLVNDTIVNVAQLIQEPVGSHRDLRVVLDWFALDTDLVAQDVRAQLRLMRIRNGVMVTGQVEGIGLVECVRCLEIYEQPFSGRVEQEYRQTIDIYRGEMLEDGYSESLEDIFEIDDLHQIDLAEPLRQVGIVSIPMQPICHDACPGVPVDLGEEDETGDHRMAVLAQLLDDTPESERE